MVEWFAYSSVFNPQTVEYHKIPQGEVCKIDGTACEVWPKESVDDIVTKLANEAPFKQLYWQVRKGVAVAQDRARRETVSNNNECGYRASRAVAWVSKEEFSRVGGGELGSPGCSAQVLFVVFLPLC